MPIFRNADDGHMNVSQKCLRSSFVILSDIVVLSAGTLHRPTLALRRHVFSPQRLRLMGFAREVCGSSC